MNDYQGIALDGPSLACKIKVFRDPFESIEQAAAALQSFARYGNAEQPTRFLTRGDRDSVWVEAEDIRTFLDGNPLRVLRAQDY